MVKSKTGVRLALIVTLLLSSAKLAPAANVPSSFDVTGSWHIAWSNDTKNEMILIQDENGAVKGLYVDDHGLACQAVGNTQLDRGRVLIAILCRDFVVNLDGTMSLATHEVRGKYVLKNGPPGTFTMTR